MWICRRIHACTSSLWSATLLLNVSDPGKGLCIWVLPPCRWVNSSKEVGVRASVLMPTIPPHVVNQHADRLSAQGRQITVTTRNCEDSVKGLYISVQIWVSCLPLPLMSIFQTVNCTDCNLWMNCELNLKELPENYLPITFLPPFLQRTQGGKHSFPLSSLPSQQSVQGRLMWLAQFYGWGF